MRERRRGGRAREREKEGNGEEEEVSAVTAVRCCLVLQSRKRQTTLSFVMRSLAFFVAGRGGKQPSKKCLPMGSHARRKIDCAPPSSPARPDSAVQPTPLSGQALEPADHTQSMHHSTTRMDWCGPPLRSLFCGTRSKMSGFSMFFSPTPTSDLLLALSHILGV